MKHTFITLSVLVLLSACSSQQSTNAQESDAIVAGQFMITTDVKRATTRFGKPACELNFVFHNGLDKTTRLNVTNLETMANNEVAGVGFSTSSIQAMSTLFWPEKFTGACDTLGDMVFREVFCEVVSDQGNKVDDCSSKLILKSGKETKIIDKRNL